MRVEELRGDTELEYINGRIVRKGVRKLAIIPENESEVDLISTKADKIMNIDKEIRVFFGEQKDRIITQEEGDLMTQSTPVLIVELPPQTLELVVETIKAEEIDVERDTDKISSEKENK